MSVISINGNILDPDAQLPALRALGLESEDASKSDYILVQAVEPLSIVQEDELENLGVNIHEYVSKNTYLCGFKGSDLQPIRNLHYVYWVNIYLDLFIIQSSLKSAAGAMVQSLFPTVLKDSSFHTVDILLHKDVSTGTSGVFHMIAAAAHADPRDLEIGFEKVRLNVQSQYLDNVAAIDQVRLIQQIYPVRLFNSRAAEILGCPLKLTGMRYEGEGQVVVVADTGFDAGSNSDTLAGFTGRVKKLYDLGRSGITDDPDGHGTHVCGSVLGDGYSKPMGGKICGTAPKAKLVVQSLLDRYNTLGGIPSDLERLFSPPYTNDGARIHTNSWGSSSPEEGQLPYTTSSLSIDKFVWDHQDMAILFASGNDGITAGRSGITNQSQIGAEAASKNCITVGASENNRPDINITYGTRWQIGPNSKDLMADHPEGLAAFSSQGPTVEGRIKPDLVAPGTAILSTRSRKMVRVEEGFGTSCDPGWCFLAGTSTATALVAGCAAVLRETLVNGGNLKPSAALIKALLINGALELPGQHIPSEAGPSPNGSSGYGRVNLPNSVILPNQVDGGYREGAPLSQGAKDEIVVNIPSKEAFLKARGEEDSSLVSEGGAVLKVTLAWTDPPGEYLQNDLDLIVSGPNGQVKHGNMGDKPGFDRTNNVEQVVWTNLPPEGLKIIVRAYHIFQRSFPQPYAVVWSINRPLK